MPALIRHRQTEISLFKSITIEDPTASEAISVFITDKAITITKVKSHCRGTTPSVTWNLRHNTDPTAGTADVFTSNPITTATTSIETDDSGFGDETIPADEVVWFLTSAVSGTVDAIHLTIFYTED